MAKRTVETRVERAQRMLRDRVHRGPGISFEHGQFMARSSRDIPFPTGTDANEYARWSDAVADAYATGLKRELDSELSSGEARTSRRHPDETGGPIELDLVTIVVGATAVLASYQTWRKFIQDLHGVIRKLGEISSPRSVGIDETAALLLAVDAVATPETLQIIEERFVAPLREPDKEDYERPRGYLVGLTVNTDDVLVVVTLAGDVMTVTPGLQGLDLAGLGL